MTNYFDDDSFWDEPTGRSEATGQIPRSTGGFPSGREATAS